VKARSLPPLYLEGFSLWSSRMPGWDIAKSIIRGERAAQDSNSPRPSTALLPPTERRRIPDTVAIALEVAARACEASKRDPAQLPCVFASAHGDTPISDYMCSTLASTPTLISPTKFHNSVHNAAAGYWTIAVRSYAPYTSLSVYESTFTAGLLEAAMQSACESSPVLFVAFDIEAVGPLAAMSRCSGLLGIGMVIATTPRDSNARALRLHVRDEKSGIGSRESGIEATPARSAAAALVAGNALAPCFPFVELLAYETAGHVRLALSKHCALDIEVG
jgi:hypothetical protein